MNRVSATNRLHARFGKAEVLDLTRADQIFHRARDLFDWHLRVDAVLIARLRGFEGYVNRKSFKINPST